VNWFAKFGVATRGLVYLRSIARSLETLAAVAREQYPARPRVAPRKTEFHEFDLDAAEAAWARRESTSQFGEPEDES